MGEAHKLHKFLCTLVALASLATSAAPADQVMSLAEIQRGQRGYGLSVFEGGEPERFDVEIIGLWKDVQPDTSYVLARLSGHGLEESGVIAGMSGSPVYVDDRLVGAVAFAWPFAQQAIAGITPIESMRKLTAIETATGRGASATTSDLAAVARQETAEQVLEDALATLRPGRMGEGTAAMQWTASGFGAASRQFLEQGLGGLASAGRAPGFRGPLVPGAAVAAVLIDGDLRLASSGTVTDRTGDTVLAFGHPFLGIGSLAVPMATAEVVTVVSSLANSFKVTNLGEVVGAFDFDHAVGIRGRLGLEAPVIPLRIRLAGPHARTLEMRLADIESVTPALAAVATLGALDSATEVIGSQGLDLVADFDLGDAGKLQINQTFDGPSANLQAALHVLAVTGYLLQNDLREVELSSIDIELVRHLEPRTLRLVGAHAARSVVRPGETVTLNFDLVEYRGGAVRRTLDLPLPTNLPAGRYSLLVGDGVSIDGARLSVEPVEPVTFAQALAFLNSLRSRRELAVLGVFGERGLSVAGEVLPRLPGSLRSLWGAAPSGSARPLRLAIAQRQGLQLPAPIEGILRIDLEVERRRPWSQAPSKGDPGEAASPTDSSAADQASEGGNASGTSTETGGGR